MYNLFNLFLFQPILNLLVGIYNLIPDIGIDIIIITVFIKLILYPLYNSQLKSQKSLQDLQPKIEELKEKYKDNKEKLASELMILYKNNKVNPFSSCLPLIIQLPILIAVYSVFRYGLGDQGLNNLYSFIKNPGHLNPMFLGLIDLSKSNIYLALLAGIAQFFQTKMFVMKRPEIKSKVAKDEDTLAEMNKQMMYMMPIFTIFIGISLPGGLTLYWLTTTILMIIQQKIFLNNNNNDNKQLSQTENLN